MTSKERVLDFINFLDTHTGVVSTGNAMYTYSDLRKSLLEVLGSLLELQTNLEQKDSFDEWDKTLISGKADW